MARDMRFLEIRETGKRTVVAFRQADTWDFQFLAHCADELDDLVEHQAFETLAFDLRGIERLSTTLIGIFVSFRRSGLTIELLNPSREIVEVLETMHLEGLIAAEHRQSTDDTRADTDGPTEGS